jgi:hypothetical protein
MARLKRDGLIENTVVVLLADHGEELFDHGEWGHCRNLAFETVLRTPLVFWIPGGPRGVEREGQANNVDVVPTLLDFLAVPYSPDAFVGESLRPVIEGSEHRHDQMAFSYAGSNRVANDGRWKVWLDLAAGTARVFDLRQGERAPVTDLRPSGGQPPCHGPPRLDRGARAWQTRRQPAPRPRKRSPAQGSRLPLNDGDRCAPVPHLSLSAGFWENFDSRPELWP